jgi:hypothetical protein
MRRPGVLDAFRRRRVRFASARQYDGCECGITEIDAAAEHVDVLDAETNGTFVVSAASGPMADASENGNMPLGVRSTRTYGQLHVDPPEDRAHGVRACLSNREPHLLEREDVLRAVGIG